jgi:hypothetical protein
LFLGTEGEAKNLRMGEVYAATRERALGAAREQTTTLSVMTSTQGTRFTWYEGTRGDTSHPVGRNASTFTTPPATRTMQYWVRLTTACGSIDSGGMTVALNGRRRAVR